jgi:hypothetical protein
MKPGTLLSMVFLAFISVAHFARLAFGVRVTVGDIDVPIWASLPAAIVCAALALAMWREHHAAPGGA